MGSRRVQGRGQTGAVRGGGGDKGTGKAAGSGGGKAV